MPGRAHGCRSIVFLKLSEGKNSIITELILIDVPQNEKLIPTCTETSKMFYILNTPV